MIEQSLFGGLANGQFEDITLEVGKLWKAFCMIVWCFLDKMINQKIERLVNDDKKHFNTEWFPQTLWTWKSPPIFLNWKTSGSQE